MKEYAIDIMVEDDGNKFIKREFFFFHDSVMKQTKEDMEKGLASYFGYDKVDILALLPVDELT